MVAIFIFDKFAIPAPISRDSGSLLNKDVLSVIRLQELQCILVDITHAL